MPMGVSMSGVPMLLDEQERFIEVPQRWLLELAILNGRTRSPATWRSYAEALYDWLRTCEANGWRWEEASETQLATYRNHMLASKTAFGHPHSESTINGRLRRIIYFYRWAARNDLLPDRDLGYESVLASRDPQWELLGHLGVRHRRDVPRILLREYRRQPRGFSRGEILAVRSQLTNERDRLIVDWGLSTGARLAEIHGLTVDRIPRRRPGFASPFIQIDLHVTKGRRRRWLWVPLELVDRTWRYIERDRRRLLRNGGRPSELWLGRWARPLARGSIESIFRDACLGAGVEGHFHMLRHTYAIVMLRILTYVNRERGLAGSTNALKAIQVLLGHASLASTAIYLQSVEVDEPTMGSAIDALSDLLNFRQYPEVAV
jgi:site-specific recombinase XerD